MKLFEFMDAQTHKMMCQMAEANWTETIKGMEGDCEKTDSTEKHNGLRSNGISGVCGSNEGGLRATKSTEVDKEKGDGITKSSKGLDFPSKQKGNYDHCGEKEAEVPFCQ